MASGQSLVSSELSKKVRQFCENVSLTFLKYVCLFFLNNVSLIRLGRAVLATECAGLRREASTAVSLRPE